MVQESIADLGLTPFAVVGLLTFFGVFVAIGVWTLTRRQKQVTTWSSLPLADGTEPVEPRRRGHDDDHECKNCGSCKCSKSEDAPVVTIN